MRFFPTFLTFLAFPMNFFGKGVKKHKKWGAIFSWKVIAISRFFRDPGSRMMTSSRIWRHRDVTMPVSWIFLHESYSFELLYRCAKWFSPHPNISAKTRGGGGKISPPPSSSLTPMKSPSMNRVNQQPSLNRTAFTDSFTVPPPSFLPFPSPSA